MKYPILRTKLLLLLLLLLKIKYQKVVIRQKTDYNTKINEIEKKIADHDHGKYITTPEFNGLSSENFNARLKQTNLASKNGIANFVKKTDFDKKLKTVTSNKNELNEVSEIVKAISTKGLTKDLINKFSILNGAKYFSLGLFQIYLVFIPAKKYIKYFSGITWIESWTSNGISEENIENITKSDSNFAPTFVDHHLLPDMNFNEHYLIKNNFTVIFTVGNYLFGSAKLTKNVDLDKYKYTGYGI